MRLTEHSLITSPGVQGHCEGNDIWYKMNELMWYNNINEYSFNCNFFLPFDILGSEAVVLRGLLQLRLFRVAFWHGSKEAKNSLDIS